jgi:hypothetical protein
MGCITILSSIARRFLTLTHHKAFITHPATFLVVQRAVERLSIVFFFFTVVI